MPDFSSAEAAELVVELLPGQWRVMATNRQYWLQRRRLAPTVDFTLIRKTPSALLGIFGWRVGKRLRHSRVRFRMDADGTLVSAGRIGGRLRRTMAGASDDGAIVVLLVESAATLRRRRESPSEGIEVLLRVGELSEDLRASVARSATDFGLNAEEFASMAWADDRGQF
ncbi:MAG: hypothetical protein H7248_08275 [Microbacteriaceae bacterium]|nr:hypothetical protein [Microbacteriaceae bacterium]